MHSQHLMDAFSIQTELKIEEQLYGRLSDLRSSLAILVARIGGSSRLDRDEDLSPERRILFLLSRPCFSPSTV